MKVVKIKEDEETCPKLPIDDQQEVSTRKKKMKFDWKANWEILLVLVIIIVGIVIITNPPHHATVAGGNSIQFDPMISNTESYDTSSTEPTPSVRLNETPLGKINSSNSRRNVPSRLAPPRTDQSDGEPTSGLPTTTKSDALDSGQSGEPIDDIHTTRSSLAQTNYGPVVTSDARIQNGPTLSMHGPYELSPTISQNQIEQLDNRLTTHQRLIQQQNSTNKIEVVTQPPLESEDMMTSYSKQPQNNLTNAMLRDYNLASATYQTGKSNASALNVDDDHHQQEQQKQQQPPSYNISSLARLRAHSASLPFTMLLNDIIRLTRPDQSQLTNAQFSELEQLANSRPQFSTLQQLRSLPAPLLALLQGSFSSPSSPSLASTLGGLTSALGEQLGGANNQLPNHDASESNQHYQRISMSPTDMSMILSRATGILPAFPPPKGTPQTWIPPTAGGAPINDVVSNNADFIAGNTAGFLRATGGLSDIGSGSSSSDSGHHMSINSQLAQQQQQQSSEDHMHNQQQQQSLPLEQQQSSQRQQNEFNNQPLIDGLQSARQQQSPQLSQQPASSGQSRPPVQGDSQIIPQQNYRSLRQNFAQNQAQQQQSPQASNYMSNFQQQLQQPMIMPQNQIRNGNMLQSSPAAMIQPGVYNSRQTTSEIIESNSNVPIVFNPINQQQQQQPQQNMAGSSFQQQQFMSQNNYQPQQVHSNRQSNDNFNFNVIPVESAPKTTVISSSASQQKTLNSIQQPQHRLTDLSQLATINGPSNQPIQLNTINRQKRSMASSDMDGDDDVEEYLDSRPLSIVSPDGRPMSNGEVKILRNRPYSKQHDDIQATGSESSSTQRLVKHKDLNGSALHHYASEDPESRRSYSPDGQRRKIAAKEFKKKHKNVSSKQGIDKSGRGQMDIPDEELSSKSSNQLPSAEIMPKLKKTRKFLDTRSQNSPMGRDASLSVKSIDDDRENTKLGTEDKLKKKNKKQNGLMLDTASSGLMSKLLGTASTNDELEEDIDSDDDDNSANERRKEELDDAEFGIVNDDARNSATRSDSNDGGTNSDSAGPTLQQNDEVSRLTQDNGSQSNNGNDESNLGSGSMDSSAYTRRNQPTPQQQRADVEFYGHPGEETRQLKYGILGSGNYEVVNGGIYPDVDESTAAVNSVANYVRKPGGVLLSGLPKLLAAAAASAGASPDGGFMPGSRMTAVSGGYMRGASANPDELTGMFPLPPPGASGAKLGLHSPLMELIDANNGHLFDPNLMAHLGSSGTSARTTFTSQDGDGEKDLSGSVENKQEEEQQVDVRGGPIAHKQRHRINDSRNKLKLMDKDNRHGQVDDHMMETERESGMNVINGADRANESDDSYSAKHQTHRHPLTGSKGQGTNQFYSYQILPSKKVTIFSDQDLDSAPSEQIERTS